MSIRSFDRLIINQIPVVTSDVTTILTSDYTFIQLIQPCDVATATHFSYGISRITNNGQQFLTQDRLNILEYQMTGSDTFIENQRFQPSEIEPSFSYLNNIDQNNVGNVCLVCDPTYNSSRGTIYAFEKNGSIWAETQLIQNCDVVALDNFAKDMQMDANGDWFVTWAEETPSSSGRNVVFIYKKDNSIWSEFQRITMCSVNTDLGNTFGGAWAVSLSQDALTLAIGAVDTSAYVAGGGAGYIFTRGGTNSQFSNQVTIRPSENTSSDYFGNNPTFNVDATKLFMGSRSAENPLGGGYGSGAVYYFKRDSPSNNIWNEFQVIRASQQNIDLDTSFFSASNITTNHKGNILIAGAYDKNFGANGSAQIAFTENDSGVFEQRQFIRESFVNAGLFTDIYVPRARLNNEGTVFLRGDNGYNSPTANDGAIFKYDVSAVFSIPSDTILSSALTSGEVYRFQSDNQLNIYNGI